MPIPMATSMRIGSIGHDMRGLGNDLGILIRPQAVRMLRRYSIYDGTIQTFLKGLDVYSNNRVGVIVSAGTTGVALLLLLPPITPNLTQIEEMVIARAHVHMVLKRV
ncbi:hypothetical protein Egran_03163, partial [Elaphomyces granulatus]